MEQLQRRQTMSLFLKTFVAMVIAYSLAAIVTSVLIRPVTMERGIVVHLSAELMQDMMNVKLRGRSYDEIASYLNGRRDVYLGRAQIATVSDLLSVATARKFGMELRWNERNRLAWGRAFTTGMWLDRSKLAVVQESRARTRDWRDPDRSGDGSYSIEYSVLVEYVRDIMHAHQKEMERTPDKRAQFIVIPIADSPYVVFVRKPLPLPPAIMPKTLVLGLIAALAILTLAAIVIIWPVVRRVRRIQVVCNRVTAGDYSARCNDQRQDSLGALASNVDEMTGAIERHLSQQKSLLQAVSHELRTPLARIRFTIAMIDIPEDDAKGLERIDSIDDDLTEIDNMLKELSYFNYVDAGKGSDHFEEVSVAEMLQATLRQRSQPLEPFDVQMEGVTDDLMITVDPTAFKRVIGNLLSNAARYAKEKIVIRVREYKDDAMTEVAVEDDGPGIPEDKWNDVFEPFVCLDPSRSKSVGGVGLGLAICDRIMKIHHGQIRVERAPGGGARMVTRWPVSQEGA